jgi:uncharacterized membrane protein
METAILQAIGLLLVGVLAGEEFIIRWGVQPALKTLPDRAHIEARVALVRRLRIVVPSIMVPTVAVAVLVVIVAGTGVGVWFRWAGLVALIVFMVFSFAGTVPINIRVIEWTGDSYPDNWRRVVERWELIDVFRSSAALVAFALFLVGTVVQLGQS